MLRAQSPADPDPSELVGYTYALDSGLGGFDVSGRSVQAYRIPIAYGLRSVEDHPWGVKLTFPVSFGIHDLRGVVEGEEPLRESFRTITFVPGVEFQIPLGGDWLLKPFAEAGFGKETSSGGEAVAIYAVGVKTLLERQRGRNVWSFATGLEWNGASGFDAETSEEVSLIEAGVDFRYQLGTAFGGRRFDSSVFFIARHFLSGLVFERLGQQPIELREQFEVGVTFGTEPRLRFLGIRLPRIGLSHRFGDGLAAYRLNFGFPF